ncbi:MAG TPA: GNAT family N-acetyltransferase [Phnomibacter sp.]|nr:GNAT family N-acetyltransferase [Phnomibacter sp.]
MLTISFTAFPEIRTERLRLRAVTPSDADALFELRRMDEVMLYLDRPRPQTIDEVVELIEKINTSFEQGEGISWIIAEQGMEKAIGTIGFWRMDKPNHRAEIGYMLHPDHWGKGYATEAMHAVLLYAFDTLKFHSIEANINPLNEASKKLLEKTGFVQEAYFRENYFFDGRFLDSVIYSLLGRQYTLHGHPDH